MKKNLCVGFIAVLLVFGVLEVAGASIINFEDYQTRNNFYNLGIEATYQGFSWSPSGSQIGWAFANTQNTVVTESIVPISGTSYAWNWSGPQSLFIDFGEAVDFNSAYFGNLGSSYGANATQVQAFGYDNAGTIITTSSVLSLTDSFQILQANFSNIYKLEFRAEASNRWFVIDDIVYNESTPPTVPEPATFILLGSGLAGLAFYRRKRK